MSDPTPSWVRGARALGWTDDDLRPLRAWLDSRDGARLVGDLRAAYVVAEYPVVGGEWVRVVWRRGAGRHEGAT